MTGGCTRAHCLSFRSCICLSGSLWISLLFLAMMLTGDHWFVLGQRIGEQRTSGIDRSFHSGRPAPGTSARIRVESLTKLAIASPLLIFLPTLSLLPIITFLVTSETSSRSEIAEQRLKVRRIFRCDAVLSSLLKPTSRSTCSLMSL